MRGAENETMCCRYHRTEVELINVDRLEFIVVKLKGGQW